MCSTGCGQASWSLKRDFCSQLRHSSCRCMRPIAIWGKNVLVSFAIDAWSTEGAEPSWSVTQLAVTQLLISYVTAPLGWQWQGMKTSRWPSSLESSAVWGSCAAVTLLYVFHLDSPDVSSVCVLSAFHLSLGIYIMVYMWEGGLCLSVFW